MAAFGWNNLILEVGCLWDGDCSSLRSCSIERATPLCDDIQHYMKGHENKPRCCMSLSDMRRCLPIDAADLSAWSDSAGVVFEDDMGVF